MDHQTVSRKAAIPISTFCESLTTTAALRACFAHELARGHHRRARVERATEPCARHGIGHPERLRNPGHDDHHRCRDEEHQRRDIRQLLPVALDGAAGGNSGRDPADRHRRRQHRRQLVVDMQALGEPEAQRPDAQHDHQRLGDPEQPGPHQFREEDARAKDDQPDLDVVLGLHRLGEPAAERRCLPKHESDDERVDHIFQPKTARPGVAGQDLRDQRQAIEHGKPDDEGDEPRSHQACADGCREEEKHPEPQPARQVVLGQARSRTDLPGRSTRTARPPAGHRAGRGR